MQKTKNPESKMQTICDDKDRIYDYMLAMVPGVGDVTISALMDAFGSAKEVFKANEKQLSDVNGISKKKCSEIIRTKNAEEEIRQKISRWNRDGIKAVFIHEQAYPKQLRNLADAPFAFFYKGSLPIGAAPTVAIVGSRACTEYGKNVAFSFGKRLALEGVQIISGMAAGADVYGHKGALSAGGYTAGVLGCGVDICYPRTNFNVYMEMQKTGGIMSEVIPGTAPAPGLFPRRNRLIAALSDAVIITEARLKSGSLITADQALEQGKDVFAVPGRIGDPLSMGCIELIRQGAYPLTCVDDILSSEAVKRKIKPCNSEAYKGQDSSDHSTDDENVYAKKVLKTLTDIPKNINRIMYEASLGYEVTAQSLLELELHGMLRSVSAGLYVRAEVAV